MRGMIVLKRGSETKIMDVSIGEHGSNGCDYAAFRGTGHDDDVPLTHYTSGRKAKLATIASQVLAHIDNGWTWTDAYDESIRGVVEQEIARIRGVRVEKAKPDIVELTFSDEQKRALETARLLEGYKTSYRGIQFTVASVLLTNQVTRTVMQNMVEQGYVEALTYSYKLTEKGVKTMLALKMIHGEEYERCMRKKRVRMRKSDYSQ